MNDMDIQLPKRSTQESLLTFSSQLESISRTIGFKISARGWCYQLEGFGLINKAQFDKVESIINRCRREGYIPIDFTAEEEGRQFSGVEHPESDTPKEYLARILELPLRCEDFYTPDWWGGEEYYIQIIVEKIDLKTLFTPVCEEFHIPIATSKGWSSMLQRAEYARRFQEAENMGLKCVLLYCGDFDPDGRRISEFLRNNLFDLVNIRWSDGVDGYDPTGLIIDRFGLNLDFIESNNLTWIDNLITGSKKDLASPSHPNHYMDYVQSYLNEIGERKCEANALVIRPDEARELVRGIIQSYLGEDAIERFEERKQVIRDEISDFRTDNNIDSVIKDAITLIRDSDDE